MLWEPPSEMGEHAEWVQRGARAAKAIVLSASLRAERYREGFDVPFPGMPTEEARRVRPEELRAAEGRRQRLLVFSGECGPLASSLAALHDGRHVIVACAGTPRAAHYERRALLLRSRFALVPSGAHSSALLDAVLLGAVPVVADEQLLLPFCQLLDWGQLSLRVPADSIGRLPQVLREISTERLRQMQARLEGQALHRSLFACRSA